MTSADSPESTKVCEAILNEEKSYNIEHKILSSKNDIIDRLLKRRLEMNEAYAELHRRLSAQPRALSGFLDVVLTTAAFWHPGRNVEARAGRDRLKAVNDRIAGVAGELSDLLAERDTLHDTSGFYGETHYHPLQMIDEAATISGNHRYHSWIRGELTALRARFDLKYWPSLSDCLAVIALDAENVEIRATDPLTEAATRAARPSRVDFFRALFTAINENGGAQHGPIPRGFLPSDATLATLGNCVLDLGIDELATGEYVKRLRQRERQRIRNRSHPVMQRR